MLKKIFFTLALAATGSLMLKADEGMWMVNAINAAIEQQMHRCGSRLSANEIYNADGEVSLCDAIVSLNFYCTGSIVSDNGLVITNHHCAYADVFAISTEEKNYLEDGFWALKADEEVPMKGSQMLLLRKVIDVTEEVEQYVESEKAKGKTAGIRKISWEFEKRYKSDSPYEAILSSMWSGSKYYIALYQVYKDIRLVAAPPVSIAAFGGDIDNWDWPQHKCDFAMYRIYTAPDGSPAEYSEENIPLVPRKRLRVSTEGARKGSFAMILGYPGSTDRYSGSAKLSLEQNTLRPTQNELRAAKMEIMRTAMNADPSVRLKYSDTFFGLSNMQELYEGETECIERENVIAAKKKQEEQMQQWIDADSSRHARWGTLISDLERTFAAITEIEQVKSVARECLLRNCEMCSASQKVNNLIREAEKKGVKEGETVVGLDYSNFSDKILKDYAGLDAALEKELFRYSLGKFYELMPEEYLGEFQKEIRAGYASTDQLCDALWEQSIFTSSEKFAAFAGEPHTLDEYRADPIYRIYKELNYGEFNRIETKIEGEPGHSALCKEYTHALYRMRLDKGIPQYPNANSTMRMTWGKVKAMKGKDLPKGVRSYASGILDKYNPDSYEFNLDDRQKSLLEDKSCRGKRLPACFVTTNDITGGNSGSPVLNARGELIGLAFDGNKESLSSDIQYTPESNRCVCVDIRYVLWVLREYAGCGYLADEMLK
ncbi:MAG: S46 family peptidase [Bacteroidales bacterium]|nr:S46 family peptidase [Bacteroidales bacterium]